MGHFEVCDDRFGAMVLPNAPLETLGEGYGWLEGPVWFADHDCLYVSDIPNDRILRWSEDGGLAVFRSPSGFANGHARDMQGRLIGCSHRDRCVTRTELDGSVTVLVSHYCGRRLNSPNDIVCKPDGTIWFSDPLYGISTDYEGGKQTSELPPTLYRFDPMTGDLTVAADDFEGPNGLAFSPDERLLYVAESGRNLHPSLAAASGASASRKENSQVARPFIGSARGSRTVCASMNRAIFGQAPPMASTASVPRAIS